DGGAGARWLLASNASAGTLNIYDLERDAGYVGSATISGKGAAEPIDEPGPLYAGHVASDTQYPDGVLLVVDEDQAHAKFVSIAAITRALGIAPGTARTGTGQVATPVVKVVLPTTETAPVESFGDAADDP